MLDNIQEKISEIGWTAQLKVLVYSLFAYLDIEINLVFVLMVFMCTDTTFGVLKVLKIDWRQFSMKKLMWGVVIKISLLLIPLLVALLAKTLGDGYNLGFGVDIVIRLLIVSEFFGTVSNIYTLKTGEITKDIDIFSLLFKFIRKKTMLFISPYIGLKKKDEGEENEN